MESALGWHTYGGEEDRTLAGGVRLMQGVSSLNDRRRSTFLNLAGFASDSPDQSCLVALCLPTTHSVRITAYPELMRQSGPTLNLKSAKRPRSPVRGHLPNVSSNTLSRSGDFGGQLDGTRNQSLQNEALPGILWAVRNSKMEILANV